MDHRYQIDDLKLMDVRDQQGYISSLKEFVLFLSGPNVDPSGDWIYIYIYTIIFVQVLYIIGNPMKSSFFFFYQAVINVGCIKAVFLVDGTGTAVFVCWRL